MTATLDIRGGTEAGAVFSPDGQYRYTLWRHWSDAPPMVFVMLNPSTADEEKLDPTLTRCKGFAERDGHGGLIVVNLYAFRSPYPTDLLEVDDPVGPLNDEIIRSTCAAAPKVVAAWGTDRMVRWRAPQVEQLLAVAGVALHRIGEPTKDGHPKHPLYLKADLPIVPHVRLGPMVSKAEGRTTLTAAEAAVVQALRGGPADTGPRTETIRRGGEVVQLVDRTVCKRLVKAGLVTVDAGGQASLTDAARDDG